MSQTASSKIDTFAADNLPPADLMPEFDFSHPAYRYPARLNCTTRFLDHWIERGHGERTAFISPHARWTYAELTAKVCQLAHVLVDDLGLIPGNRVLLRAANNPMMVAAYLAVIRAGGIAVGTMPLLRARELSAIVDKAEISHALCDVRLKDELLAAQKVSPALRQVKFFDGASADELEDLMAKKPSTFTPYDSRSDECCLIAFTSGTTGLPKGTMHFQRDMLAICDGFSAQVLKPEPDDIFAGSPPLAFTFGLGGLALFPMHAGAASLLLEAAPPLELLKAIEKYKVSVVFTAPTAYRAMLPEIPRTDISSWKKGVSAGEHLPKATWEAVHQATGIKLIDGLGSTELLHVFITSQGDDIRPGATGKVVPGYSGRIIDENGDEVPHGTIGRLAVKGPTGCRYLADQRQTVYVQNGWNVTGDAYSMDADGYFWFAARADDMIISAGYNISGPEVENALLEHPAVGECAVVGKPDSERGMIVKAFVVVKPGNESNPALIKSLQDHVKQTIAPYKYPREIEFLDALPKTQTGKLQRFKLREQA